MRDRFIPALITLIAGAITCIFDIYRKADLLSSLKRLLLVIVIFYVIGLISRAIIRKTLEHKPDVPDEESYIEENEDEAEDDNLVEPKDNPKNNPKAMDNPRDKS